MSSCVGSQQVLSLLSLSVKLCLAVLKQTKDSETSPTLYVLPRLWEGLLCLASESPLEAASVLMWWHR